MVKNSVSSNSLEKETSIFEITIAYLANSESNMIENDLIELNDTEISFELFKNVFYHNNYRFFELNTQYKEIDELKIHNKTIKNANFKSYKNGTKIDLVDIMSYKFIKNKKLKVNDFSKLAFTKEISAFSSLLDFKVYNTHLSYDNILDIYNHHINKKHKKYFRFKVKANYYSADLDETISLYFNYLVKIPKKKSVP